MRAPCPCLSCPSSPSATPLLVRAFSSRLSASSLHLFSRLGLSSSAKQSKRTGVNAWLDGGTVAAATNKRTRINRAKESSLVYPLFLGGDGGNAAAGSQPRVIGDSISAAGSRSTKLRIPDRRESFLFVPVRGNLSRNDKERVIASGLRQRLTSDLIVICLPRGGDENSSGFQKPLRVYFPVVERIINRVVSLKD